ncbi:hypothetical protein M8R90_08940 [Enterobacter hormaechei]|uniref:hypothetical protein n=1 Tax=Enterobacter TaxID=547 RepID=UPI001F5A3B90|nr:hypothetical protein [Enterobacter sp. I4]MCI2290158.1 hypothetical protein [Enterobacter sp. I4]MCM7512948.1 hypothetical protein [Enterobacter hormaechei]
METNKKDIICEYALNSLGDIASFARFVSYAEDLSQLEELFENNKDKEVYEQIWFELEIINALALSQWETEGYPSDWKKQWESGYKQDATHIMGELLNLLK